MSINLIIRKTLIYGITYTLCLSIFSFIVILLGQLIISGSIDKRVFSLSMLAVFIIVSIVKPLDNLLTTLTDKFLFRQEYEYHQILKTASLGMISIRKLDKLLNLIITIITKHVRVKHASIFLLNKETNTYIIEASKGKLKIPKHLLKFNQQKSFIRYLNKTKSPIVCEELKLLAKQQPDIILTNTIEEMERLEVAVCVPSFLKGKLTGFLLLGEKLSGQMYSQEDLSLFNTLSFQTSLAIENAQAYEELSQTKDKLFETEKLASIGRLAGGIAHEIKNPLSSIKTFTAYLNKNFDDPEFRDKFQRIVGSEVDRINHIVEQLVFYAHPKQIMLQETNPHKIIEETLSLLENELKNKHIQVKKQYLPSTKNISADFQQLKQVFLNLFLNSIQAIERGNNKLKEIIISIHEHNNYLKVEITDTGEGIIADKIPLIFDPFFTTKESGSGLGLAIVKSIVETHHGEISVRSELNKGTTFCLSFPIVK